MTERPNLFKFATSELSQDAFLCWLLSWADQKYATVDPDLHRTATNFLKSIGKKCKKTDVFEGSVALKVEIKRQHEGIDVLALISIGDQEYALVIEDKTDSTAHSGQLSRYRDIMEKKYSESNLLLVYLKTGEILPKAKREAKDNKYVIYSRKDLLQVLEPIAVNTKDSILRDFYQRLKCRDDLYRQYLTTRLDDWKKPELAWEGFFSELQKKMEESNEIEANKTYWQFVNNPSGGEFQFGTWRRVGEFGVHLQLVKKWGGTGRNFLAFKIGEVRKERREVRNRYYRSLMEHAKNNGWTGKLKKPDRWGNGSYMVIAESKEENGWISMNDGKINMEDTIEKLNEAYELFREFECE